MASYPKHQATIFFVANESKHPVFAIRRKNHFFPFVYNSGGTITIEKIEKNLATWGIIEGAVIQPDKDEKLFVVMVSRCNLKLPLEKNEAVVMVSLKKFVDQLVALEKELTHGIDTADHLKAAIEEMARKKTAA